MPSTVCVSAPSFELHKPEYLSCGAADYIVGCYCLQIGVCCDLKINCGDVVM